jgi:MFS transporter, FSR family, fosmidomycin resistance protein
MAYSAKRRALLRGAIRFLISFAFACFVIEFLDEFVFGAGDTALPNIRDDIGLDYIQIGILLNAPGLIGNLIDPLLGIWAGMGRRKQLIRWGGVAFTLSLFLTAISQSFWGILAAFVLFNPASGALVNMAQMALMDAEPARREQNMARWTFAGSLGMVMGSIAFSLSDAAALSWRWLFVLAGALALVVTLYIWRVPVAEVRPELEAADEDENEGETGPAKVTFRQSLWQSIKALRKPLVLRWLILLEFGDLLLDVLLGFLALYFVDVVGVDAGQAGVAVLVWVGVGLIGDFLLIPILERVPGLVYLRLTTFAELLLFVALLLMPGFWAKLPVLGLLGFFNAGWYAILQAQLYAALPGQSNAVMIISVPTGLLGKLFPLFVAFVASQAGLGNAMWLLLFGPVVLLLGLMRLPAHYNFAPPSDDD